MSSLKKQIPEFMVSSTTPSNMSSYQTQKANTRRAHSSLLSASNQLVKYYSRKNNSGSNDASQLFEKVAKIQARQSADFSQNRKHSSIA